ALVARRDLLHLHALVAPGADGPRAGGAGGAAQLPAVVLVRPGHPSAPARAAGRAPGLADDGGGGPAPAPGGPHPPRAAAPPPALTFGVQGLRRRRLPRANGVRVCPTEDGVARRRPVTCEGCGLCWEAPPSRPGTFSLPVLPPGLTYISP